VILPTHPLQAVRVVGPIVYTHREGCTADAASFQAASMDGRIWRCQACGVRVATGVGGRP
jgi:hypothetical protein